MDDPEFTEELVATAERTIARLRSNIKLLLDAVGASEPKPCTGCDKPIRFIVTKTGKKAPITQDGLNHFADCPAVTRFKR